MIKNIFRLFAFILFTSNSTAQIEQVEPLNWWVGMKNKNLQLLIHGNLVGETIPVINYPGVVIKKINKADSKNYLFIDLLIAKNTNPGIFDINFKKEGKIIYSHKYSLLVRSQDEAQIKGFNSSDVIYLITPDRFANGDYSNDVVAGMKENKINRYNETSRHGGDLRGIINHLDYISEMGFTAIWPTPVLENNMPASSYHGYAITNRYKVDPRFGTLEEYKELAEKAKQKGIKLIFDDVINHTGAYYWWMSDLPFKNWINNPDSFQLSNHRRTVNQDKYASSYDRDLLINGWFDKSMPDLNGQNPFMANYLIQSSIWWIETLQLGGIRQDTYPYSDKMFSKNWSCSITNEYPNFNIVGEEWSYNPLITSYWQQGKKNEDGYISCLKSVMDFALQSALIQALKEPEGPDFSKGLTKLYEGLANDFAYANPKSILIMGDNHDMDRIFTQLNKDVELTKMALTYLLTVRGIPQLYYGTELLMDNSTRLNNHGYIRSDFPGGWKEDKTNGFTGTSLSPDQLIFRGYLKKLLNWRKNNPVIANGETLHFAPFNGVYVYFRFTKEKTIMVVLNKNNNYTTIDTKRFNEILKNKTIAVNVMSGENVSLKNSFTVKGKTAAIYDIK